MKKNWYKTNVTKAILVIIAHILVIVMTTSFIWIVSYPALREELFAGNPAKKYEDSRSFIDQMLSYSQQAVTGVGGISQFETDGKYDPDKIVDIESYDDTNTISGKNNSGLAYKLGDLLEWANIKDSYDASEDDIEPIVVCEKKGSAYRYYRWSDFYDEITSGKLQLILYNYDEGDEYTEEEREQAQLQVFSDMQNGYGFPEGMVRAVQNDAGETVYTSCWIYDGTIFSEKFSPIGENSVLSIVNKNPKWNGRLNEAYSMIENVMYSLQEQYSAYKNANENIEEGDTNYSYIYVDTKNKHIYTNKTEYRPYDNLNATIEKMKASGKYIIVNPKLADFETNMKDVEASSWRDAVKYAGLSEEDFIFAAAVDTKYPVQDVFYSENKLYDKYGAGARRIAGFGCIASILLIGCFLWLVAIAGRNDKDKELHLNAFDRWKTEIAALVVILLWAVPMFVLGATINWSGMYPDTKGTTMTQASYLSNSVAIIAAGCVMTVFTCSMFMVGLLSLVRRIKANTVWKNSVFRYLIIFIKDMFEHLNCIWKTVLLFGVFVLVHWMAIAGSLKGRRGMIFFMLLLDGGAFVYLVYKSIGREKIRRAIKMISGGEMGYKISLDKLAGEHKEIAQDINSIGEGLEAAVAKSVKSERLKTDLITNVSHDIKTPLTSIINYVDLLKQEHFEDPKVQRYIEVLEQKSQRLKTLTEDVVEASKVSSGNITLEYMNLNLTEMIQQVSGEFEERFQNRGLTEVLTLPEEEVIIRVDGRRMWRVFENIYSNASKYAMEGTRVYAELTTVEDNAVFSLKNISEQALNISADELTERFIRGDISRSTEGSGLGLSIAKTLTQMQGGSFELYLDGDLFKVTIKFPRIR